MVGLPQPCESGPPVPLASSDGPSPTRTACVSMTIRMTETPDVAHGETHVRWFTRQAHEPWPTQPRHGRQPPALAHGPQHTHAETWPQCTSETDVGQHPPEWCCNA